ncbi:MAG: tetratricopeptide repeat protein [Treponema sp.]|jgi:tetratricopeptide (TPR) repeat protein|nr:tetratricopeptide repeat protein [Treponema sp.]
MKLDPILTRAIRLARRGGYDAAIKTLEPEVNRYHDSFRYYYILGVSCLRVNDFQGALTYFKLAREVRIRDPNALLGMAVLYLRRGETGRAVDFYLEVQELDPKNAVARKALAIIRRYAGQNRIADWLESGEFRKFYPPLPPIPPDPSRLLMPGLAVLGALTLAFLLLIRFHVITLPGSRGPRPLVSGTVLEQEDRQRPVETGGAYRYILTRNQVLETYDRGLSLFTEYRDEAARLCFNRLIESNASEGIKEKSRLVISYMEVPGFDTFKRQDNYAYGEVIKDPVLYRGCHVIWQGMATNIETFPTRTSFDFLIGYDTRQSLEGISAVEFDRAVAINPERPLEVLARIVPVSGGRGEEIRLEGLAIHQSGLPDQGSPP